MNTQQREAAYAADNLVSDDDRLDLGQVAGFYGVSVATINRVRKSDPNFPEPERLRPNGRPKWRRGNLRRHRADGGA